MRFEIVEIPQVNPGCARVSLAINGLEIILTASPDGLNVSLYGDNGKTIRDDTSYSWEGGE